ncbi:MAG: radical SAM protein, partial [Acidovorax sp.]
MTPKTAFDPDLPEVPAEVRVPIQAIRGRGAATAMPHRFTRDVREVADDGWGRAGQGDEGQGHEEEDGA